MRARSRSFFVALLLTATAGEAAADPDATAAGPFRTGLVERTGTSLVLVDVEVTDEEGRPVPGLTIEDFEVQLNGRAHPVSSLDDFCPPGLLDGDEWAAESWTTQALEETAEVTNTASAVSEVDTQPTSRSLAEEERFVLYLDFSMLGVEGRARSLEQARRWVREQMRDGEQAQVVTYTSQTGLRESCPFTSSRDELLEAIDAVDGDPAMFDSFVGLRYSRIAECRERCCGYPSDLCPPPDKRACCVGHARRESSHGRRSMRALAMTLRRLEARPGRKTLIYFHDSGVLYPGRYYDIGDFRAGDLNHALDEVAAEANLARVGIHVATPGGDGNVTNLGANLADYSGGSYNRGLSDFASGLDRAGRHSGCFYRIGLRRPQGSSARVFRTKVWVRGESLPHRRRVVFLDEVDHWWRQAQDMLFRPDDYRDLDVRAVVVPRRAEKGRWDVDVRVAVALDTLTLLDLGEGESGEWEVGGLMARADGKGSREMIARSKMSVYDELGAEGFAVHARGFTDLRPATWRFASFARDRTANLFGAAQAELALPDPSRPGIAGPIMLQASEVFVVAGLPLLEEKAQEARTSPRPVLGAIPATSEPIPSERPIDVMSWICGFTTDPPQLLTRFVTRGEKPLFRFEEPTFQPAGDCLRLVDRLETIPLAPGTYEYHVRWMPPEAESLIEGSVGFEIADSTPPEEAEGDDTDDPEESVRLERLLSRLGRVADLYLDNVLRFTCEETILHHGRAAPILHRFHYVYVFSKEANKFRDYRVPHGADPEDVAAGRIDLSNLGLPVYLLRAYSMIFIFRDEIRPFFDFFLEGDDEVLDRPALKIKFEARRPYMEGINDWMGTAWIDRESGQLLRVEALRPEDYEEQRLYEASLRPLPKGQPRRKSRFEFTTYETVFDMIENGMRFPGKVTIRGQGFAVGGSRRKARVREYPIFEVGQTYKRYRFFGVRTEQEIGEILAEVPEEEP